MRIGEQELLQDLRVYDASVEGDDLVVSLYGGAVNACVSARFTFRERAERDAQLRRVMRWRRQGSPLAFLQYGDTIALLDERALLDRATGVKA